MSVKKQFGPQARIFICTLEKEGRCRPGEGSKCAAWAKVEIKRRKLKDTVWITKTRCQGYCDKKGTAVTFAGPKVFKQYSAVRLDDFIHQTDEFLDSLNKKNDLQYPEASPSPLPS